MTLSILHRAVPTKLPNVFTENLMYTASDEAGAKEVLSQQKPHSQTDILEVQESHLENRMCFS
jgi:hypothetical protein